LKISLNLNFEFENAKNRLLVGITDLPVGMTDKPIENRSKFEFSNLEETMVKTARQITDDETEGLVSGEAAGVKSQTQIRL
jgi:hypothetical protein